ncbi:hypothetical protein [Vibrio splendidus]|uniref:hypothetical protein n=1 Tax=Vibrio splendidus TaxID=29497 RepID=UPI000C85E8DA|nr:hypothetical protein [Vibrio splendidus]PMK05913.1 hypothetical protein BCU10_22470 [Vibrio splendidus]
MASEIDWVTIGSSILAGGFAGQLVTLLGGYRLTEHREHKKWLKSEKYKLFTELLTVVSKTPQSHDDLKRWTYDIREISQRLHILFPSGTSPEPLSAAIETVFKLAQAKKDGNETEEWEKQMRESTRLLRKILAESLKS